MNKKLALTIILLISFHVSCSCGKVPFSSEPMKLLTLRVIGLRGRAVISNNTISHTIKFDGDHFLSKKPEIGDSYNISIIKYPSHQKFSIDQASGIIEKNGNIVTIAFTNKPIHTGKGVLKGKKIALSPGHGLKYTNKWHYQRKIRNNIREDDWTQKVAIEYLIPSFERCNAQIINLRERSYEGENYTIDNDTIGFETSSNWITENKGYLGTHKKHIVGSQLGLATWPITTERSGWCSVYTYIIPDKNYASMVDYKISHAWGTKTITIDQSHQLYIPDIENGRDRGVWYPLGTYYFYKNQSYSVQLSSVNAENGKSITADAIRLGGGQGFANFGNGHSGKLQWQQGALSFLQEYDAPDWVMTNDITARPLYAIHHMVDAYLSIHANLSGKGKGTLTCIWNNRSFNIPAKESQVSKKTVLLAYRVHDRIVETIKHNWDNKWADNVIWGANFGELREFRKAWIKDKSMDIPAILLEIAYMDRAKEANLLKDNLFITDVSYAITKAVIDYFAARDGVIPKYPPISPEQIYAERVNNIIKLTWKKSIDELDPQTQVDYYLIYFSIDGKVFNGQPYKSKINQIDININHNKTIFYKITAVNKIGESIDSDIVEVL